MGTPEAEKVGQTVLASQFAADLRPHLQSKVVGMEGGLDQLVLRARFKEAKSKELAAARSSGASKLTKGSTGGTASSGAPPATDFPAHSKKTRPTNVTTVVWRATMPVIVHTSSRKKGC